MEVQTEYKFKLGGMKKIVKEYKELSNRKYAQKRKLEDKMNRYMIEKSGGYCQEANHVILYMIHKVEGAKELFDKRAERMLKIQKENEKYNSNLKEIEDELKVGDIILDDEGTEWKVITATEHTTEIQKRRGKMVIEIEGGKGEWTEILGEDSDGEEIDREPIRFEEMFIDNKL